jgi:hypothetical protein
MRDRATNLMQTPLRREDSVVGIVRIAVHCATAE